MKSIIFRDFLLDVFTFESFLGKCDALWPNRCIHLIDFVNGDLSASKENILFYAAVLKEIKPGPEVKSCVINQIFSWSKEIFVEMEGSDPFTIDKNSSIS